jgi:hypothetical protein
VILTTSRNSLSDAPRARKGQDRVALSRVIWPIAGFMVGGLVSVAADVVLMTHPPRSGSSNILQSLLASVSVLMTLGATAYLIFRMHTRPLLPRARLIRNLRRVEMLAHLLLSHGERRSNGEEIPVRSLRAALVNSGVWSLDDLKAFDRALKVRNSMVHGDVTTMSWREVRAAGHEAGKLADKLNVSLERAGWMNSSGEAPTFDDELVDIRESPSSKRSLP